MIETRISTGRAFATTLLLALAVAASPTQPAAGCSTVMVGKQATADGSVLMASSCDGDVMGLIYIMPAETFPPGTKLPMYWNVPRPRDYNEYRDNLRKGYDLVGYLPVEKTCRTMIMAGNVENMTTGGLNEHGLSIAIEFLPMREGLACDKGVVGPNSNHWTTSLIANGLRRARTAREAIRLIGSMVDEYGFLYYRAPTAGVALPIADKSEIWLMEIFGPGKDWTPASGKPGGVWCARRIPDGEVGCRRQSQPHRQGRPERSQPLHRLGQHLLAGPGVGILERRRTFRLARRLRWPRQHVQLHARMASAEPGSARPSA